MSTMIYSPRVEIHIATGTGATYDVSEDISNTELTRALGISHMSFTLTNTGRKYDGLFTPMDKIVVYLTRVSRMLAFSGYLDQVPAFSTFSGSVNFRASCSLKRLQHFMWDPNTDAAVALLEGAQAKGGNNSKITDGGISKRAVVLLNKVAGWPLTQIHIAGIPSGWFNAVATVADGLVKQSEISSMMNNVGAAALVGGTNAVDGLSTTIPGLGPNSGTGTLPANLGTCSQFGGPNGGAYGGMALTGEPGGLPDSQRAKWGGPFYCLPGRTNIYTNHGPIPIKDVREGDLVWSFDGRGLSLHPVTDRMETGVKPLWRITTKNTRLDSTEDHRVLILSRADRRRGKKGKPFRLPEGGHRAQFDWVRADEVVPGDVVVTTGEIPENSDGEEYPSVEIAEVIGLVIADGTRNIRYATTGGPRRFNLCMPIREHKEYWIPRLSTAGIEAREQFDPEGEPRCCITFLTDLIQPWCADVMREKSPDRFVPAWVWTAPRKVQEAFLRGYMAGDGSVGQSERTQGTQTVACTSQRLTEELRVLCHYLGYRTGNLGGYETGPGSFANARLMHRFVFYVEPTRHRVPTTYAKRGLDLDLTLASRTVLSSQPTGTTEATYDIEVAGTESFIADGVVVHNCAMRWPYQRWNSHRYVTVEGVNVSQSIGWWKKQRLVVMNHATGKACVVRCADWGPFGGNDVSLSSANSRIIDLSEGVMKAIGASTDTQVGVSFAPAGMAMGPVDLSSAQAGKSLANAAPTTTKVPGSTQAKDLGTGWGDPASSGYVAQNIISLQIPGGRTISVHRQASARFSGFLTDLYATGYRWREIGGLRAGDIIKRPDGSSTGKMGNHAYGAAIDIDWSGPSDAQRNGFYSTPGDTDRPHLFLDSVVRPLAHKWGLWWGGDYHSIKDYMHFEVIGAPATPSEASGVASGTIAVDPSGQSLTRRLESGSTGVTGDEFVKRGADVNQIVGQALFNAAQWMSNSNYGGELLSGVRTLMNDVPIFGAVEDLINSSLRQWCSAPNGDVIAWFPDYFGHYGTAAKMVIEDIEIEEGFTVAWSDDTLKTHMFVTGAPSGLDNLGEASQTYAQLQTAGIASVEMPELMSSLFNIDKRLFADKGVSFLNRFGARTDSIAMDSITGARQEFFFACFRFMQNWSEQYSCQVGFTFMPELYPGMLAVFPRYGVQAYVQEVRHSIDMNNGSGFRTSASLTAWSTIGTQKSITGLPRGGAL